MFSTSKVLIVLSLLAVAGIAFYGLASDFVGPPAPAVTQLPPANLTPSPVIQPAAAGDTYTVLAWNDLGMHCISPRFAEAAILPPFNNLHCMVIKRGVVPTIVTAGLTVTYGFPNNTTAAGKTDFWTYSLQLFGADLPVGQGLTGNGLSGTMAITGDHFEATGIPLLPFNDDGTWAPYQQAVVTVKDDLGNLIGSTTAVVPVSDEMSCQKCHATGKAAAKDIATATVDGNILTLHDRREGTSLMDARPVLCASCHSSPALGTPGAPGVKSMSLAMHAKHSTLSAQPSCADCHPGPKTQCNRSSLEGMGPRNASDPGCSRCHGDLKSMAAGLKAGRTPWLQEPTCAQCHGNEVSTGTALFRNAKGHGGVACIACHNSPHAWWPSMRADDNAQPLAIQGNSHAIGYKTCLPCHTDGRLEDQPPHNVRGAANSPGLRIYP